MPAANHTDDDLNPNIKWPYLSLASAPLAAYRNAIVLTGDYTTDKSKIEAIEKAVKEIQEDLKIRYDQFKKIGKIVEAERIKTRTEYDIEMMIETGYCQGIENYIRYLNNREPGEQPATLLDYFPDDSLIIIDESHISIPQISGMHAGNYSRKTNLIEHGFRLPSAHDNRPLKFEEFERHVNQAIYTTATPGKYEFSNIGI